MKTIFINVKVTFVKLAIFTSILFVCWNSQRHKNNTGYHTLVGNVDSKVLLLAREFLTLI